jgi:hypothetical protein
LLLVIRKDDGRSSSCSHAHSAQFPGWSTCFTLSSPGQLLLLNPPTTAAPGLRRIGVEARPTAVGARFRNAARVDALIGRVGKVGKAGCDVLSRCIGGGTRRSHVRGDAMRSLFGWRKVGSWEAAQLDWLW